MHMLWLLSFSVIAGVLIGLCFRVPAVLAAAALLVTAVAIGGSMLKLDFLATLGLAVLAVTCLQTGYLGGALISGRWQGARAVSSNPTRGQTATGLRKT